MNERICKNCKWWFGTDEVIVVPEGWCHRMPHTEPTNENDWCGEFER